MHLAVEIQRSCFYVIAASKRDSEFSTEARFKYFIFGAFSCGFLLYGCSMIHGFTGVPNFEELLSQSPHLPQYISHYKKYVDCERNKIVIETPM
jgi:NADH:ubiquinone oxidoreductase subunit 2 (subunit N)